MASTSSPYAIFRASDWGPVVAQPIGLRQCLRVQPKKYYPKSDAKKKTAGAISKKALSSCHVQLAFAWRVFTSAFPAISIVTHFLRVVLTHVLSLKVLI